MNRDNVVAGVESFEILGGSHAVFFQYFGRAEGIDGIYFHAESLGYCGDIAAHLSECLQTDALAGNLRTGGSVVFVADGHDSHADNEFCHGAGVLSGSIFDNHTGSGSGLEVYVVVSCTCTDNNFQLGSCFEESFVHLVAAHDERVGVGRSGPEFVGRSIFLDDSESMTGLFDSLTYGCYSLCRERFFGCYEYFHMRCFSVCCFKVFHCVDEHLHAFDR